MPQQVGWTEPDIAPLTLPSGMSVATVGRIRGSVSRLKGISPEELLSTELFVTVGLEHRLTASEMKQLRTAGLNAGQIDELDATFQHGRKAPGQHTTRCSQTKKGKSDGLSCEFYSDLHLHLYHGWERTTVVLKVCCRDEKAGKRSTRVLGTFETPATSMRAQACSGFFDIVPSSGSKLSAAQVKVNLTLEEEASPAEPERAFDIKDAGFMGGIRRMTLGHNGITVRKGSGALANRYSYADIKRVAINCERAEVLLFVLPGHLQTAVRYVADDSDGAAGIAARIQSEIHEFAVNVAVPGLTMLAAERQSEEAAKLAETRMRLRTSSADGRHALTHQTSLAAQTKRTTSVTGDVDDVRISPIAQLNCNLLMADTTNDVGKALQTFAKEWSSWKQTDATNALQRVRVFCDTGEFPQQTTFCCFVPCL